MEQSLYTSQFTGRGQGRKLIEKVHVLNLHQMYMITKCPNGQYLLLVFFSFNVHSPSKDMLDISYNAYVRTFYDVAFAIFEFFFLIKNMITLLACRVVCCLH